MRRGRGWGGRLLAVLGFIAVIVLLNYVSEELDWGFFFF